MTAYSVLDRRVQSYLRAQTLDIGDCERIACFVASFDAHSDNPYLNYALPEDGAEPDESAIAGLVHAFVRRGRKPRLEYISAAAPSLEAALIAAGFAVEDRLPIMTFESPAAAAQQADGFAVTRTQDDAEIVEAAQVVASAFGDDASHPDRLRRLVQLGAVLVVARDGVSAAIVGAGVARPIHDGVTEIAGIGVASLFRRRGIAGAITSQLAHDAVARGADLVWLSPGSEEAQRIYACAGFSAVSKQLHISRPL